MSYENSEQGEILIFLARNVYRREGLVHEMRQKKRDAVPNFRAPLRPIITTRPRELVTMDLVEYPVSNDGNRYVLVAIDNFTKYLELFALNEGTAAAIADKLTREYIPRHGAPEQLHSDQGKNLNAKNSD